MRRVGSECFRWKGRPLAEDVISLFAAACVCKASLELMSLCSVSRLRRGGYKSYGVLELQITNAEGTSNRAKSSHTCADELMGPGGAKLTRTQTTNSPDNS